eukprot:2462007-Amphidinium_carterae.1
MPMSISAAYVFGNCVLKNEQPCKLQGRGFHFKTVWRLNKLRFIKSIGRYRTALPNWNVVMDLNTLQVSTMQQQGVLSILAATKHGCASEQSHDSQWNMITSLASMPFDAT